MNNSKIEQLGKTLALVMLMLVAGRFSVVAQGSVEKAETSQQAQQRVDELERARLAVAKPGERQEAPRTGRIMGDYSVTSSLEVGYRTVDTSGSRDKYLSDINVRDGFRVLDYSFDSRSINGHGLLYDFMRGEVSNAGGDQSQSFSLRADKTRAYKFDASVRRFNYFRVLPNYLNNWHSIDTRQQISDFGLKLFPQRKVRVNLGYNRSMATGFAQSTITAERDVFVNPGNRRWESNDFRLGVDVTHRGWDFFAEQMYRNFRWDSTVKSAAGSNPGFFPTDLSTLTLFNRDEPTRSRALITRASMRGSLSERVQVVVRGMYGDEFLKGIFYEPYAGTASPANTRVLTNVYNANGSAKRPSAVFDGAISFDLSEHWTLNNTFRYSGYRILGDSYINTFRQQQTGTGPVATSNPSPYTQAQVTPLGFFGDRGIDLESLWNTLDLRYAPSKKFSVDAGWRTTRRTVKLSEFSSSATYGSSEEDTLHTNTGILGLRFRPVDQLNLFFDYENGQADNVFVRIAPMDFQRVRARATVQATEKLSFTATLSTTDRTNPTPFVQNDQDYRSASISAFFEPNSKLWLTGGYNYDDVFSTANIYFFIAGTVRTGKSLFYSKQHFYFLDSRIGITKYVDLLLAYRYLKDRGAPSSAPVTGPNDFATAFPLKRHNPEARLAIHLGNRTTLNVNYRHYSYNEKLFSNQDYRSNIVTTSARFTF